VEKVKYINKATDKGNIVIRVFKGEMRKEDIVESFYYMINNNILTEDSLGLITDIREAKMFIDMKELERMVSFIFESPVLSKIKLAVVVETSKKIMLPALANLKLGDSLMYFRSVDSAQKWLID
jgi:hypothetical protein